jgi:hypothetical protein
MRNKTTKATFSVAVHSAFLNSVRVWVAVQRADICNGNPVHEGPIKCSQVLARVRAQKERAHVKKPKLILQVSVTLPLPRKKEKYARQHYPLRIFSLMPGALPSLLQIPPS